MVSIRVRSSVRERLRKYSLWGEIVGGSSRSGRVVTTRHSGDGWCRFVSVRLFARDLENIHEGLYFSCNGIRDWLKIEWSEQSCMKLEVVAN